MTDTPPIPTPVPTTNVDGQDAVTLIENLGHEGEALAEAGIIQAVPAMGAPVLKQLWEAVFDWLVNYILKPTATMGGAVVISFEEYTSLKDAAAAQVALDAAKKTGDANAISKASAAVDAAVAGVVHYVGATHA